ncbi:Endonuclease IV [Geoglobus ahangari]|uniref:Endonuclease IV n=1 Tax=Geoglobus ahangari TaxID=113653 RepID=A0A0F7IDW6_9EURY|nr:deoxyribonuclease IV [Geoglobus ahangari]AKG90835.1 Endonuclease IV [Geoglobus ahangari]
MLFGTAGVPNSSPGRSTVDGVKRIRELNLDCMEVQFVRGVKMRDATAKQVRMVASSLNVTLSVHAPYYINLNADSEVKVRQSVQRLYESARIGSIMGARNIVFHPGYYMKRTRDEAFRRVRDALEELVEEIRAFGVVLRPETSGKREQFGELEEIVNLCAELDLTLPCIDVSHIHARTMEFNSYEEFFKALELVENALGSEAVRDLHVHISGIEYDSKGEKRHLNLRESDFRFTDLLRALSDYSADGLVICESPNLEEDAVMLKKKFEELRQAAGARG